MLPDQSCRYYTCYSMYRYVQYHYVRLPSGHRNVTLPKDLGWWKRSTTGQAVCTRGYEEGNSNVALQVIGVHILNSWLKNIFGFQSLFTPHETIAPLPRALSLCINLKSSTMAGRVHSSKMRRLVDSYSITPAFTKNPNTSTKYTNARI